MARSAGPLAAGHPQVRAACQRVFKMVEIAHVHCLIVIITKYNGDLADALVTCKQTRGRHACRKFAGEKFVDNQLGSCHRPLEVGILADAAHLLINVERNRQSLNEKRHSCPWSSSYCAHDLAANDDSVRTAYTHRNAMHETGGRGLLLFCE